MYKITFSRRAIKLLEKIPQDYQLQIKNALLKLANDPFKMDLKKLSVSFQATHRLRVGVYRIFLLIDTENKEVSIGIIIRRSTQTYR